MDTLSQDLLTELECPVCYEIMLPPIRLCLEGHSICNTCRLQLDRCPTCRKPLTNARNRVLEKVAEKLSPVSSQVRVTSRTEVTTTVAHTTSRVEHDFAGVHALNGPVSRNTELPTGNDDDGDEDDDNDLEEEEEDDEVSDSEIIEDDEWIAQLEHFDTENTEHRGVSCDGCGNSIEGYRYKCLQCPNFDLCTVCEERQLHASHYMLRMPAPAFWCQHFGKNLARRLRNQTHNICRINDLLLQSNSDIVSHIGVSCDGCSVGIRGFRYKCIQCRDYDLCGDCEGRGVHTLHFMIRMPLPTIWDIHYGNGLALYLRKSANKICNRSRRDGQRHKNFRPLDQRLNNSSREELTSGNHHEGVTCDGCHIGVYGFRFKCLQCCDFDLCSTCEGSNSHADHYLLRMPDPKFKCKHIGRRLANRMCDEAFEDCCCYRDEGHFPLQRRGESSAGDDEHTGVTCDGCRVGIRGFRYKCIECHDYDLCAACERTGLHKKHFMVRMPVPTVWCQNYGRRLARYISGEVCHICRGRYRN